MELAAKIDSYGKGAWIALMVVAFVLFWPIGLALLAYLLWSGRLACSSRRAPGRWHNMRAGRSPWVRRTSGTGNSAFDEYREETLRRLEEEQEEFEAFLERLRKAKDRSEFDQFMRERSRRPAEEGGPDEPEGTGGENADEPNDRTSPPPRA